MGHIHKDGKGKEVGVNEFWTEILHVHSLYNGGITAPSKEGPAHTHKSKNGITSRPIPLLKK